MILAINPGWIGAITPILVLVAYPLLLRIYKGGRDLFVRLDHQDQKLESNNRTAVAGLADVATQINAMATAQKEANGKVGALQLDVAMLKGTVYGKDGPPIDPLGRKP